ncbi:MAG TPA: hypothetical protein ENK47_07770 [Euryarchaeota archaeon]|nr:hypothetical protein [Euryarchaeota archaeon]
MEETVEWLLEGPPYVRYRTEVDLLGKGDCGDSRSEMLSHKGVRELVDECRNWPGPPVKRHNDSKLLLHKLCFLSELGLNENDPWIEEICESAMGDQDPDGPFRIRTILNERYGGSGREQSAWYLCDAPTVVYSLAKLGWKGDERVLDARNHLLSLVHENGWRCAVSSELGKFRGPGRKTAECPYANLVMLKMISAFPDLINGSEAGKGISALCDLWTERKVRRPFLFAMGTDFMKLKAPMIWYNILHVTEVLSRFPGARKDERFLQMVDIIRDKADDNGRYTAESIYLSWAGWDFSRKKEPSPWITYRVLNILKRL